MKLSIIIAAYNVEMYVAETIKSIESNLPQSAELIVVNDGSTDQTLKICESYTHCRNVRLLTTPNRGLSHARNTGLRACNGDYVWFVDGDDFVGLAVLNEAVLQHVIDLQPDVLTFGWQMVSEQGKLIGGGRDIADTSPITPAVWNKWYRKQYLLDNTLLFPEGELFEDNAFTLLAMGLTKRHAKVNEVGYYYRQRTMSITNASRHSRSRRRAFESVIRALSRIPDWQSTEPLKQYVLSCWWTHMLFVDEAGPFWHWLQQNNISLTEFTDLSYQLSARQYQLVMYLFASSRLNDIKRVVNNERLFDRVYKYKCFIEMKLCQWSAG